MSSWTIKTVDQGNGKTRALCPISGCHEYREHAVKNTAAKFITGHLVAKHQRDGVRASDTFTIQ